MPLQMQKYSDLTSSDEDDDDGEDEKDKERERILQEKLKFYREKYGNASSKLGGSSNAQIKDESQDSDSSSGRSEDKKASEIIENNSKLEEKELESDNTFLKYQNYMKPA